MPARARPRLATPADGRGIARVQVAGWQKFYRGILPDARLDGMNEEARTERWTRLLATEAERDVETVVLVADAAVLGFCCHGPCRDAKVAAPREIYAIYVDPPLVRRGHGTALWQAVRERLAMREFNDVVLWVLADNGRALRFYERVGFTRDETVAPKEFEDTGALEILLRAAIPLEPHG